MRAVLNLPLVILALALARVFAVTVVIGSFGDNDATIGTAYEILFEVIVVWLNVGIVLGAAGAMGGLRWPGARGFGGFMLGIAAFVALVLLAAESIGIAMEPQASLRWPLVEIVLARLVAYGLPLMVLIYGGWIANSLAASRRGQLSVFGVAGVLCVIAAVVSVWEIARDDAAAAASRAASERAGQGQAEDPAVAERRRAFQQLTDANSLVEWSYFTWNVPADVRTDALQLMARRPRLEEELAEMLREANPDLVLTGMDLIVSLPFTPSPALDQPVREAVLGWAERLVRESKDVTSDGDTRIDRYRTDDPRAVLPVTERMAAATGEDLRDAIDTVARAVALFPKSEAARSFPGQAAEVKKQIGEVLAGRGR